MTVIKCVIGNMATNFLQSFLGGALIGLSVVILLIGSGRITGISGILNGLLHYHKGTTAWRIYFMLGLTVSGYLLGIIYPQAFDISLVANLNTSSMPTPYLQIAIAGILVGFGTVMGTGCTSGHGICGLARLSPRSLAATLTFMIVGILTATWLMPLLKKG